MLNFNACLQIIVYSGLGQWNCVSCEGILNNNCLKYK